MSSEVPQSEITIPPAGTEFLLDPSDIRLLVGPRREGKTSLGVTAWLLEAQQTPPEYLPYKVIVCRDTWTNLRRSVHETLREFHKRGLALRFAQDATEALFGGGYVKFYFLGMDQLKDLNKFQGFGAAGLWIEEPAPAAVNDIGGGLPPEVLGIGFTSLSQEGCRHRVIITQNPPDEDHWTLRLGDAVAGIARSMAIPLTFRDFWLKPGDNPWITDLDRAKWRAGLEMIGRGDLVSRLSEGKPGFVIQGEPVTLEYSESPPLVHVAPEPLQPIRRREIIRSWDYGLTPVCVWSQVTPLGHWQLLDAVIGEGIGLAELIEIHVQPWERRYLGDPKQWRFRNIGGPEATQREQSSSQRSALQTMLELLGGEGGYEAGPVEWPARIGPLKRVLGRTSRGKPLVQVDPDAKLLRRTLRGGAYYPKDSNGQVVRTVAAMKRVCVDGETEMLSATGWRTHEQLQKGEPVYAWRDHKLILTPLVGVHYYEEPTECYRFENRGLSMVLTPEHRLLVRRRLCRRGRPALFLPPELVRAEAVRTSQYVVRTGTTSRRPTVSDDVVRLCGWVMAEGSYQPGQVRLAQSTRVNAPYVEAVAQLIERLGQARGRPRREDLIEWRITGNLAALIHLLIPEKRIGPELWSRLSVNQLRLFLYEAARGDGHWSQHPGRWWAPDPPERFGRSLKQFFHKSHVLLFQRDKAAADALQITATLAGIGAYIRPSATRNGWVVGLSNHRRLTALTSLRQDQVRVPFVWCPETDCGTWVARRRGTVFVTGNSGLYHNVLDALAHAAAILYPMQPTSPPPRKPKAPPSELAWMGR